jgi:RHS repeat-associated protein
MDYDVDNSLILYYPEIKSSKNAQTKKELFALDSEGRNLILELGEVKSNIQSVRLYPALYSKQGETVSKVQEYEDLFKTLSEYNLVVKIVQSGEYTLVPSHTIALESGYTGTTWSLYKDMAKGVLEIRFSSGIQTDEIKVNVLIDGRNPQLVSDTPENYGLLMNPTARESESYFDAVGALINSVEFMAEVEYVLNATQSVHFDYDVNGNRTSKTTNYGGVEERQTDYTYEPGTNRLQNDGEYSYEYDADGNLRRRYNTYVEYVYQWNLQNRLEKVYLKQFRRGWNSEWEASLTEAQLNEFLLIFQAKYDESGQRYWKWARRTDGSEVETGYAYTSMGLLYERSDEGGVNKERSYIYAAGKKLAQIEGSLDVAEADGNGVVIGFAAAAIKYMVCDQLGSTRLMVDAVGAVAWYGEYAPFGESSYEASLAEGVSTNQTFTSYTRDMEIGLQYAMNRYYLPELGRFISEDPGRDGINWYVYCANNPLVFVDPSGLRTGDQDDDVTVNTTIPEEPPEVDDPLDELVTEMFPGYQAEKIKEILKAQNADTFLMRYQKTLGTYVDLTEITKLKREPTLSDAWSRVDERSYTFPLNGYIPQTVRDVITDALGMPGDDDFEFIENQVYNPKDKTAYFTGGRASLLSDKTVTAYEIAGAAAISLIRQFQDEARVKIQVYEKADVRLWTITEPNVIYNAGELVISGRKSVDAFSAFANYSPAIEKASREIAGKERTLGDILNDLLFGYRRGY